MIDERSVPSVQCKMSLRGSKSMRKVDGLSRIFIEFYVPVLTPRLNSMETSLQLSGYITFFAVCRVYTGTIIKETSIDTRSLGGNIYIYTPTFYMVRPTP
jgi:hypothetical protein